MIFGTAIMLLLIMLLVRTGLIDEWRAQIPENTPNHFVMNVAASEAPAVEALLTEKTSYEGELFPMIRGRHYCGERNACVGVAAQDARRTRPEWPARRPRRRQHPGRTQSHFRFRSAGEQRRHRRRVVGRRAGRACHFLEDEYAEDLGLGIGDVVAFDIGGLPLIATVTNLRRVEWDSLRPNFFIIFSPGALDGYPATYMTSFFLERAEKRFLNELLSAHPTITVIEVDAIITQVRSIIDRVSQAVELVLYLVLAAGALVLIASIQSSRDQRLKEHALLRALGGTRKLISGALASEFAVLGLFAGLVAVIGAEITVYALNSQVFELGTSLHPWLWLAGPTLGMAVIATVGYLGTRKLVHSPPVTVLREV